MCCLIRFRVNAGIIQRICRIRIRKIRRLAERHIATPDTLQLYATAEIPFLSRKLTMLVAVRLVNPET